jgi:hypothetical protein
MDDVTTRGLLTEWVVLVPELAGASVARRRVGGHPQDLHVLKRTRRDDRGGVFSGSSPRQRRAMEIISGGVDPSSPDADDTLVRACAAYPAAADLHTPTRGALLLTFAADTTDRCEPPQMPNQVGPEDVATLFSLAFPKAAAPIGRIGFKVKVPGGGPIVDRQ